MKPWVIPLPGNEALAKALVAGVGGEHGALELRQFPDGETYVRVLVPVAGREVIIAASLHEPDHLVMPLYFLASTLRELGATRVVLVAPYLAYMRQDMPFHPGEGTTARHFARWLSAFLDGLVTVDPHLHRIHDLAGIYSIPTTVVAAAPAISAWLREHIPHAMLIGPDAESEQWVRHVADDAGCPYTVLEKTRHGDREVSVSVPHVERYRDRTPVLLDDIISTGRTMAAAAQQLKGHGLPPPVGIGVHAILAGDAEAVLRDAGLVRLLTCNTIAHVSNGIDLYPLIVPALAAMLETLRGDGYNSR